MSILEVNNVSIRYMTGDFKEIGLKEYVMRKLTRNYHISEFWADRNVSFTLEKGDMLGIIGTNGAGKSTLLKVVSGIMEPSAGAVRREGTIAALLELGSGFDGDLTVRENTYLRGAMLGYTKKFMDDTYDEIIDFAELRDFQDRPFKQLSSGMKSRLAFSIASLVDPDILILDEVLSVGDGAFRKKSEDKMREIISGGATTILVSHSLSQVRELCNKVLWLHKGEQIAYGENVEEICDQYQKFLDGGMRPEDLPERRREKDMIPQKESAFQQQTERRTQDMNDNICRTEAHEGFWKKTCALALVCFLIAFLVLAMVQSSGPWGESGSTLLAAVSLSNHGSFRITQEDLDEACAIFPEHAGQLKSYYAITLPKTPQGDRYPFYLGVYAPLCLPALSILRLLHFDAAYAFSITNALLLSLALWVVYRFAKISAKKKLLAILLLGTSPMLRYINVQLYETALFSFVVMAMVFWLNRQRKRAALFLSIAGTMNSTVMAFGFFMILDYFLEMFRESSWSAKAFFKRFAADWKKTAGLAVCFLPCFVPFVISRIGLGCWYYISSMGMLQGIGGRFLAYLFDLNLGLLPYFPALLFLFAAVTVWGGIHGKRYDMLCTFFGALAVIGGYSLIRHINCGMTGMARYNTWLFPIIALGTVYYMDISFSGVWARRLGSGLAALSCAWCVFVIGITAYSPSKGVYTYWDPAAETVLKYAPGLYDPLPSTFYSRTLHIDGGYNITDPAYYLDPQTNEVRKLIYKADEGQAEKVLDELKGDEESVAYLREKLEENGVDGKYHYIDFPARGAYQLTETTPEERGELADTAIAAEGHDLTLKSDGNCLITALPLTIKENTAYKVEIAFESNSAMPDAWDLHIDLYGPNYDHREQEVYNFLRDGIYSYTFYFDSGTIDGAPLNGFVRVFSADENLPLKVELLRVTEMERLIAPICASAGPTC